LGLPSLLIANRRWRYELSFAIPASCLLGFIAWGWWSLSQSIIGLYALNSFLMSWSIHLVTGILGLMMIKKQNDQPL
jgi:lipopolysaccharide export LptBFGC system permease protein LptF